MSWLRFGAGWVALITTCLLGAAWIRSITRFESMTIELPYDFAIRMKSSSGKIACWVTASTGQLNTFYGISEPLSRIHRYWEEQRTECAVCNDAIRARYQVDGAPYWLIVVPATLLSAHLLLNKSSSYVELLRRFIRWAEVTQRAA